MKYMLFAGDRYYARGGMNDFYGLFNSVEEAVEFCPTTEMDYFGKPDWYQVVNATSLEVVKCEGAAYNTINPKYGGD